MKRNIRWINKQNFSRFASIAVALLLIFDLVSLVMSAVVYKTYDSSNLYSLISPIISIVFMLLVCNYFYKSRDNLYYAFYAILLLLIAQYLIPFILTLILGLVSGLLSILLPSLTTIIAIVYFIFLVLENKKREKKYSTVLMIVGFIFAVVAIVYAVINLVDYSVTLSDLINAGSSWTTILSNVITIIEYVIQILALPLIFASYPLVLRKERMY